MPIHMHGRNDQGCPYICMGGMIKDAYLYTCMGTETTHQIQVIKGVASINPPKYTLLHTQA